MLPARNTESNVEMWHDTSPAYLYSYDNWHLKQQMTLVARFVTDRTALRVKALR